MTDAEDSRVDFGGSRVDSDRAGHETAYDITGPVSTIPLSGFFHTCFLSPALPVLDSIEAEQLKKEGCSAAVADDGDGTAFSCSVIITSVDVRIRD